MPKPSDAVDGANGPLGDPSAGPQSVGGTLEELIAALKLLEPDARRLIRDCENGGELFERKWHHALKQARAVITAIDNYRAPPPFRQATGTTKPTSDQIWALSHDNPVVKNALMYNQMGVLTFEEALEMMVLTLVETNRVIVEEAQKYRESSVQYILRQP